MLQTARPAWPGPFEGEDFFFGVFRHVSQANEPALGGVPPPCRGTCREVRGWRPAGRRALRRSPRVFADPQAAPPADHDIGRVQ